MEPSNTPLSEPRFVTFDGKSVIGRKGRFTPEERPKVPALWESTIEEIGSRMFGIETFGVSFNFDGGTMDYLVGIEDDGDADGLDRIELPAGRYAVFEHDRHISSIGETWQGIFDQWAPSSGVTFREGPEFELYQADFHPEKPGGVTIWVPVVG